MRYPSVYEGVSDLLHYHGKTILLECATKLLKSLHSNVR